MFTIKRLAPIQLTLHFYLLRYLTVKLRLYFSRQQLQSKNHRGLNFYSIEIIRIGSSVPPTHPQKKDKEVNLNIKPIIFILIALSSIFHFKLDQNIMKTTYSEKNITEDIKSNTKILGSAREGCL